MSASAFAGAAQNDWSNREVSEVIQMQILKMAEFLNKFNLSTRHRLATIEGRLSSLQRSLAFVEAALGVDEEEPGAPASLLEDL
jgi:uncharacterized protein